MTALTYASVRNVRAEIIDASWFDRAGYPFEPHYVETPAGRLHYVDEGTGDAVLLIHGTPGWSYEYREVIQTLARTHRVIAPDHLGFGFSDRPVDWPYTLAGHTENLERLVAHLGLSTFALVVQDFGGVIALPLVWAIPGRVTHVVLMNTWCWPMTEDPTFAKQRWMFRLPMFRWLYLYANASAKLIVPQAWGRFRPLTPAVHRHYTGLFPDAATRHGTVGFLRATWAEDAYVQGLADRLDALRALPALLVWGTADTFIGAPHLARWRRELPGATVITCDRVGHFVQDEAAPLVSKEIQHFLNARAV